MVKTINWGITNYNLVNGVKMKLDYLAIKGKWNHVLDKRHHVSHVTREGPAREQRTQLNPSNPFFYS